MTTSDASPNRLKALFGGIAGALSHPVYRRYWLSNSFSSMGRWMLRVAVGWLTWELTESPAMLGLVAFADSFPMVVFSLIGGAVADRIGYLRVMRFSQLSTGLITILFGVLVATGQINVTVIVILTALTGSLEALSGPARLSVVHSLVPKQDLAAAIALGSTTFNAARTLGPAIAGPLLIWAGIPIVIFLSALTFLQFWAIMMLTRTPELPPKETVRKNMVREMIDSVHYVHRDAGIYYLMLMLGLTALLIRPYIDLLAGVSDQMFGRGPDGLSILLAGTGLGGFAAGLYIAARGRTDGLTQLVTTSLLLQAIALVLFTIFGNIWFAAAALVCVGFYILVGGVGSQTLIQNAVDSGMRARVMSLFIIISWGIPALGALAMGWLADFIGLQITLGGGGVLAILAWLLIFRRGTKVADRLELGKT
ncbi:MAG: MFS transporter [Proteobacteria bacterium]|nr:MFS transporter [Pseudomonadota bacterium]